MAGQTTNRDVIVRAELAIEILNHARGLVSERVAAIEVNDPVGAEALRARRREQLAVQNRIRVDDAEQIEAVIAEWGPRVKDAAGALTHGGRSCPRPAVGGSERSNFFAPRSCPTISPTISGRRINRR